MPLAAPAAFPHAFAAAWAARDAAALAALFAGDADFVNVVGIWWEARDAIERAHGYALGSFFANSTLKVGRVKLREMGEVAVVHARLTFTGQTAPDGSGAEPRRTLLLAVLRRNGEGWLCVAAQSTEIVPGAETFRAEGGHLRAVDYR